MHPENAPSVALQGKHCTVSKWLETQPAHYIAAVFDGDVVAAAPKRGLAATSEGDRKSLSILSLKPEDTWIDHGADVQLYNRLELRISGRRTCLSIVSR